MERYVWVRNARARFADVLNTAAYGVERVVILRRGEELGAFVGTADLDFLRRHRPRSRYPEPAPPDPGPDPEVAELVWREGKLDMQERLAKERGASPGELEEMAREREYLARLREYLVPGGARVAPADDTVAGN